MRTSALSAALLLISAPALAESYVCKADNDGSTVELTVQNQVINIVSNPVRAGQIGLKLPIAVNNSAVLTAVKAYQKTPQVDAVLVDKESLRFAWSQTLFWENGGSNLSILHGQCQIK